MLYAAVVPTHLRPTGKNTTEPMQPYLTNDNVSPMSNIPVHLSRVTPRIRVQWAVQPIIDLDSTVLRGVELLARNPDCRTASGTSVVEQLSIDGRYELFRQGVQFAQQHATPTKLYHVNLAAADSFMAHRQTHFENLVIEITEGTIDSDDLESAIKWIQTHGGTVALDDLGASEWVGDIDLLIALPWDLIKLDRSFLWLDSDQMEYYKGRLAPHFAPLCLEGIERSEDLSIGVHMQATMGQGYYFGRPWIHQDTAQYDLSQYPLTAC